MEVKKIKDNIITIDGPAGSGKSTIAKILSRDLNFKYVDTGAMYRAITLLAIRNNVQSEDEKSILGLAENSRIEMESKPSDENQYTSVRINGSDVTNEIRSKTVGSAVSTVSKLSGVRKFLVGLQREIAKDGRAVLEGRDTGSVVFPNAILKIFLTASLEERIKRRKLQESEKGNNLDEKEIKNEITSRDEIDSSRADSPLIIPEDAVIIDSSNMKAPEVAKKIKNIYNERIQSEN